MHAAAHSSAVGLRFVFVRIVNYQDVRAHAGNTAAHAGAAVGAAVVYDLEFIGCFLVCARVSGLGRRLFALCARVSGLGRRLFARKENEGKQLTKTRPVDNSLYIRVHGPCKVAGV